MPSLHMEVDVSRSVVERISQCESDIQTAIGKINTGVLILGQSWYGSSTDEFLSTYNQWHLKALRMLEELQNLKNDLEKEIDNWEELASKLA